MKQTNMLIKLPQAKFCNFMLYFKLGKEKRHQNNRKWITNSKWKAMQKPDMQEKPRWSGSRSPQPYKAVLY